MSASAAVSTGDRLSFTIFVAVVLHAILIFGVAFTAPRIELPNVMEVTLAQHQSSTADKDADFLAQANQKGSGSLDKAAMITSPHQSRFHDSDINEIQPEESRAAMKASESKRRQVITTTASSRRQYDNRKSSELRQEQTEVREAQLARAWQSDEISSLEARLAAKKQAYAKRPKVRTVATISTRYDRDAAYVDAFRSRVEEIGNKNYPEAAKRRNLYGNVRLLVAVLPSGRVKEIVVLKSSGHRVLDEAARQSVRLAEPFMPFPASIRKDTDILQVIRTWKFSDSDRMSAEN
ncbi:MAG TPA: energy transducer TonB [Moraxellaceae bacterium]|nr:energy transducer TonB [Moraxellaceae bacterium]